ncbi:MAG: anhydro-N-acetylmuramic acid kinase [Bacteroidales bacterium]|jgi:anhydro-N-acetylmuramic acid kinase|nr:anhydro-N-acetylmuramic acid kinase [Bacteroidales bacterium]
MQSVYKAIGVMSGTSLDGLDLAYCEFRFENTRWTYTVKFAETLEYSDDWKLRLKNAVMLSGLELAFLNVDYGHFLGESIQQFVEKHALHPDLIAVHGHTIFHQPDKRLTLQIGDGAAIASYVKLPVVTQFRNTDVALGGQGAPLVPIGDKLLFNSADFCLNLGGIANISFTENAATTAFDICVCNMALNSLASQKQYAYDKDGQLAKSGQLKSDLLSQFNQLDFFKQHPPKSLGFEWFEKRFLPILNASDASIEDKLHTVCEHIAIQISNIVNTQNNCSEKTMIVTGGGAKNEFLMSRIKQHCSCQISDSHLLIIDFKEALIFAFLGVLRMRGEANCLAEVTGAKHNAVGGCVYV